MNSIYVLDNGRAIDLSEIISIGDIKFNFSTAPLSYYFQIVTKTNSYDLSYYNEDYAEEHATEILENWQKFKGEA